MKREEKSLETTSSTFGFQSMFLSFWLSVGTNTWYTCLRNRLVSYRCEVYFALAKKIKVLGIPSSLVSLVRGPRSSRRSHGSKDVTRWLCRERGKVTIVKNWIKSKVSWMRWWKQQNKGEDMYDGEWMNREENQCEEEGGGKRKIGCWKIRRKGLSLQVEWSSWWPSLPHSSKFGKKQKNPEFCFFLFSNLLATLNSCHSPSTTYLDEERLYHTLHPLLQSIQFLLAIPSIPSARLVPRFPHLPRPSPSSPNISLTNPIRGITIRYRLQLHNSSSPRESLRNEKRSRRRNNGSCGTVQTSVQIY